MHPVFRERPRRTHGKTKIQVFAGDGDGGIHFIVPIEQVLAEIDGGRLRFSAGLRVRR